jgi:hypothetical protein
MAAPRMETIVTCLLQIVAAALAITLVAAHQAPGESWLAPVFMGFLAAVMVDQGRAVWAPRIRQRRTVNPRSTPAGYRLP